MAINTIYYLLMALIFTNLIYYLLILFKTPRTPWVQYNMIQMHFLEEGYKYKYSGNALHSKELCKAVINR